MSVTTATKFEEDSFFEGIIDRTKRIGSGTGRVVYAVSENDHVVIKEAKNGLPFSNHMEWVIWCALEKMGADDILGNEANPELKDKFAKCFKISMSGRFLMMERLFPSMEIIPHRDLPFWANDIKPGNFGKDNNGTLKMLDYAHADFYAALNPKNRTQSLF